QPLLETSAATRPAASTAPSTKPGASSRPTDQQIVGVPTIDNDLAFATSISKFERSLIPIALNLTSRMSEMPLFRAVAHELMSDLEQTQNEIVSKLRQKGFRRSYPNLEHDVNLVFLSARREAMSDRMA